MDRHSLDGLRTLQAVAEAGSFLRAGEALGLTQSAVSRAVARVEERVGVRIFRRTARSISFTEEGRQFYETVLPHMNAIQDATLDAGRASSQVRGRLRVSVDGGTGPFLLVPRLQPFLAKYPELFVEIVVRDRLGDLVSEGFDCSVRFGAPQPSSLQARLLTRTRIVTCAAPSYLARHGAPRHPTDLEKPSHRCVQMRDPTTRAPFGYEFMRGKKVVATRVVGKLLVDDAGALFAASLSGYGVAQLLELYAREYLADGRLVQVLPDWADETYPLYAYHPTPRLMSARVRAFLDFVVAITR